MTLRLTILALLVGCESGLTSNNVNKDDDFEEEVDEDPPIIVHDPVGTTQTFGVDVPIEATVTDEGSGVLFVYLHYKNETDGAQDWKEINMQGVEGVYTQSIRGSDMRGGGVDYFIEAVDYAQNTAFAPDDGQDDPYHFRTSE